ncbi:MAG: hypothetical protein LBK99_05710 [Opitutaceae bacterium]|nr:hypothetical protein [Opitutaceae bacterium]
MKAIMLDPDADLEATCALLGCSVDDIIAELERRHAERRVRAEVELASAARSGGLRRAGADTGAGGFYQKAQIHAESYHYWGQRLGYECWDDPQFMREYLRDVPAARVRTVTGRVSVVVQEKPKRFSKNYGVI